MNIVGMFKWIMYITSVIPIFEWVCVGNDLLEVSAIDKIGDGLFSILDIQGNYTYLSSPFDYPWLITYPVLCGILALLYDRQMKSYHYWLCVIVCVASAFPLFIGPNAIFNSIGDLGQLYRTYYGWLVSLGFMASIALLHVFPKGAFLKNMGVVGIIIFGIPLIGGLMVSYWEWRCGDIFL